MVLERKTWDENGSPLLSASAIVDVTTPENDKTQWKRGAEFSESWCFSSAHVVPGTGISRVLPFFSEFRSLLS